LEDLFFQLTNLHGGLGILAIFGVLLLCGFGLPVPEDIPLISAGYLIHLQQTTWVIALLVCLLGVLTGDSIIFWFGKRLGNKLLRSRLVMFFTTPKKILKIKAYYRKYGPKIIIAGRFLPGLRAPIFFVAGSTGLRYRKFITYDGFAAMVSVPIWLIVGFKFGNEIDSLLAYVQRGKEIAGGALGAIVLAYVIYVVWKAKVSSKKRVAAAEAVAKEIEAGKDVEL
jgi:membrane protein DedA with SNARE-associated domain